LWLQQAESSFAAADYRGYQIITNTGPVHELGQIQEFLTLTQSASVQAIIGAQASPVPEPNTALPVGMALVAVSCAWRRCRKPRQV